MQCQICKAHTDRIEPLSSKNFPICVYCIDDKVIEIAERKAKGERKNESIQ